MIPCSRPIRVLLIALVPLAIAGCPTDPGDNGDGGNGGGNTLQTGKLIAFQSQDELLDYFRDNLRDRVNVGTRDFLFAPAIDVDTATAEAGAGADDGASATSFTQTNIQEAGVDESDVFKTDGEFIYLVRDRSLRIIRANPAAGLGEISRLELDIQANSLYLTGSKLLILGHGLGSGGFGGAEILIWPPYYANSTVRVLEVDVADPAAPQLGREIELDGSLVDSRLIEDRLVLITTIVPSLPDNPTILEAATLELDEILPKARTAAAEVDLATWDAWLHPEGFSGYNVTAVVTLNVSDISAIVGSLAIVADAGAIYATQDALYVTDTDYTFDQTTREKTTIHKIIFGADGAPQYVASGEVNGRPLNQFSLGEQNGFLRIATYQSNFGAIAVDLPASIDGDTAVSSGGSTGAGVTGAAGVAAGEEAVDPLKAGPEQDIAAPPTQPSNALYVLGESNGQLVITGSVEGLAPGERLYAARFLGDRGFLVTFRQIDPLFVLDLADPANPQLKGELKIPGYSDYLHPFGDLLIGVGRTADASDTIQLSLFNVADLTNPTVVEQIALGESGSWSEVSSTHKAFTFDPASGRMAIPAILTDFDPRRGFDFAAFQGVIAFNVTADGFTELGRVPSVSDGELYASWQRALFIGDSLFSVSPLGVGVAPFTNLGEIAFSEITE